MSAFTTMVRKVVWSKTIFQFWQFLGVDFTKKHFYSPIPDIQELRHRADVWSKESNLSGIDMNLQEQLHFLENIFPAYKNELNFPVDKTDVRVQHEYYLNNAGFGLEDACTLHCMIRHFKPRKIIEVGSGNSTLASARAVLMNEKEGSPCRLIAIEPYPREYLKRGFPGLDKLIISKAEQLELSFFEQLEENDILFIDSSHVLRIGNDVNFLYLEVLPYLKKGVIVHIHDIFFPYQYPQNSVINDLVFWNEQYVLQAFLSLNCAYEVLFGNYCMTLKYPQKIRNVFVRPQGYKKHQCSSFWIRRKK